LTKILKEIFVLDGHWLAGLLETRTVQTCVVALLQDTLKACVGVGDPPSGVSPSEPPFGGGVTLALLLVMLIVATFDTRPFVSVT
jgi:hypothetical protein